MWCGVRSRAFAADEKERADREKAASRCTRLRVSGEREIDGLLNFGSLRPETKKGPTKNAGVPLTPGPSLPCRRRDTLCACVDERLLEARHVETDRTRVALESFRSSAC